MNGQKNGHVDPQPGKGNDQKGHKGGEKPPVRDKKPTPSHAMNPNGTISY